MCTFMYTCSDTKDSNMDIQELVTSSSNQQRLRVVRRSLVARRRFTRRGRRATPAPSWRQKSSLSRRQGRLAAAARRVRTLRLPEALLARGSDCLWCLSCCSLADGWASRYSVSARVALIADLELSASSSTSAGQSTSLADERRPRVPLLGR